MKKMTQKQFKETFESAGFNFDVWGWEGVLNLIAMAMYQSAKNERDLHQFNLAARSQERADIIADALRERGYYNN